MQPFDFTPYLTQIKKPDPNSRKGDNGRVLVIGGSRLFHAAAFWSASMASRLVDMVHFSSPVMENNELMRVRAKGKYWDGIVIPYEDIAHYIAEDDAILIGPGMERGASTRDIVNDLLRQYPNKKWIVDGGALQEVDPILLTDSMIITPNHKELQLLKSKISNSNLQIKSTVLAKGETDTISCSAPYTMYHEPCTITGGSPGLTRGGTGDVLSGLVAGLAAKSDNFASCVVASYILKSASEELEHTFGSYFSPNDLIIKTITALRSVIINK